MSFCLYCDKKIDQGNSCYFCRTKRAARFFGLKERGEWVEKGCDKCGKGMSKKLYDFQRKNRLKGTICSKCSKKEDLKP